VDEEGPPMGAISHESRHAMLAGGGRRAGQGQPQ
jgi:hypothetical protein